MAGFLYLIKGSHQAKDVTPDLIERHGLTYAFEGKPSLCGCRNLPPEFGGGEFTVLADPRSLTDATAHFDASKQTWRKIPKKEAWIGVVNASRPTPADLVRKRMLPGGLVEMGDGTPWMIPIARRFDLQNGAVCLSNALPCASRMNDAGEWIGGGVLPAFTRLNEIAQGLFDLRYGDNESQFAKAIGERVAPELAAEILGVNYRVSDIEVSELGLMTDLVWEPIRDIVIDRASWEEIKKKVDAAS